MQCSDCNQDHKSQKKDYPNGAVVVTVAEFEDYPGAVIPSGAFGVVKAHCLDGRAAIVFDKHSSSHTFHHPEGYIKVVPTQERAAHRLQELEAAKAPLDDEEARLSAEFNIVIKERNRLQARLYEILARKRAITNERGRLIESV